jgi:hypothetical protein
MRFATEDLPEVVKQIRTAIADCGLNLADFDITTDETKAKIRVESHGECGGFIVNVFSSWDLENLVTRVEEIEKPACP